ncbi:MAG: hypothetical protein M0Q53_05445 [Prolixibacteraceae bacterium]|jgi:hypothetical protein|nr:hypothetical protein [Prolixibacteraceae bacterium]
MIAKKTVQIFSELKKSSLQFSLQKQQLSSGLQRTFRLRPSLQLQTGLQAVCKGNLIQYQTLTAMLFAGFVCTNANLAQAVQITQFAKN